MFLNTVAKIVSFLSGALKWKDSIDKTKYFSDHRMIHAIFSNRIIKTL